MGFYEQISKYYDNIFPAGAEQLDFLKAAAGEPPKRILDIACGSGGYSLELADSGHIVSAIDLDEKMIEMAKFKSASSLKGFDARVCNMLDISGEFGKESFDLVFCIGNSIVHLGDRDEILKALVQMHECLSDGGSLVLQIINYDRITSHNISSLPAITDETCGLTFVRNYEFEPGRGIIHFNTILSVKNSEDNIQLENSVELLPLLSEDLSELLLKAEFSNIKLYGSFSKDEYDRESYMLVVKAGK